MTKGAVMLLVLFITVLSAVSEAHRPGNRALAHGRRPGADPVAPTHLHFYFHDSSRGTPPTSVRVAGPAKPSLQTLFGAVYVMDDPLTERPELGSAAVGRAQGFYIGADQTAMGFLQVMNLVLTSGAYNGSSLTVLGRNFPLAEVREMPIVGGTGAFRFARGYAQARTYSMNTKTGDANVEYDVYVMH
ncbi:dirigent protein 22-like [Triticum dicoccoides]|nr:dirigent protein 22-like [Triticum dicoccoides]